jgi:predicted small metal-binding protein
MKNMAKSLACRDLGSNCDYIARGETIEEMRADIDKHGIEAHGFTDEMLKDPELNKLIKASTKSE